MIDLYIRYIMVISNKTEKFAVLTKKRDTLFLNKPAYEKYWSVCFGQYHIMCATFLQKTYKHMLKYKPGLVLKRQSEIRDDSGNQENAGFRDTGRT